MTNNRDFPIDSEKRSEPSEGRHSADSPPVELADPVDTDEWAQVHQDQYDAETDGELGTTLVFTIAEAKGVDPLDYRAMSPLYDTIDAQSLEETFFGPWDPAASVRGQTGVVSFVYEGYKVVVRADGWIFVFEPT